MNLFELQENLKNFSQDQLVREMRNPTGTAPQYLILSELQRRRRIMNEEQAQMPQQASVAEEAVAAAGMPQGGLAQMAQAMAPQTDMTQNTAAQPVERMMDGGQIASALSRAIGGNSGSPFAMAFSRMLQNAGLYPDPPAGSPTRQELASQMNTGSTEDRMAALDQYKDLYSTPSFNVRGMAEGGKIRRDVYERNRPRETQDDFRGFAYTERMAAPEDDFRGFAYTERMADDPIGRAMINARAAMRTRADERYEADLRDALSSVGSDYEGMGAREKSLREEDSDMRDMIESLMRSQSETVGGFAEGGEVRRMDVGGRATGLAAINRNLADFIPMRRGARGNRFMNLTPDAMGAGIAVDALIADPRVQAAATASNMSPEEYISALNSEQFQNALDMLNTPVENAPLRDEGRLSDEEFMASRYDGPGGAYSVTERSGVPGRARLSESGLTGVEPVPTVSAEDIRRMANENRTNERIPDGLSILGAGIAGPYTEFLERMAETPLFPERRGMQFGETPIGAIQSERTEEPMDETLRRILANSEAAIARESAIGMTPDSTYDAVPFARARLPEPDLRDEDRARRTAAYVEENLARDARGMPERELVGMSDRTMAAQMDSPFDVDVTAQDILAGVNAMYPDQRMSDNELANLELQGFDDTDQSGAPGYGFGDMARDVFGDAAIDEILRNREIGRERERTRALAGQFEAEAEAADAETAALDRAALAAQFEAEGEVADAQARVPALDLTERRDGAGGSSAGGGGAGGSGGAGGGAGASSDDIFEQDKWLALAQFGLGLMSSQAPTLGQAIGEAGATGIAALRQAREDQQARQTAAQTRADRLAAAAARASTRGGLTASNLVSRINSLEGDQRQLLVAISQGGQIDPLTGEAQDVSALEQMFLNNQLELERLRSSLSGAYDVGSEEVFDATGS